MTKEESTTKNEILQYQPCLIVLTGSTLAGKSAVAENLKQRTNLYWIDLDVIRDEIDESRREDPSSRWLPDDKELEIMIKTYKELCHRAKKEIDNNKSVLITGSFARAIFKEPLEDLLNECQSRIPYRVFVITTSDSLVEQRLEQRRKSGSASNVDSLKIAKWGRSIFEKIDFTPVIEITNNSDIDSAVEQVLVHLVELEIAQSL